MQHKTSAPISAVENEAKKRAGDRGSPYPISPRDKQIDTNTPPLSSPIEENKERPSPDAFAPPVFKRGNQFE
jgi:hypothetical protein